MVLQRKKNQWILFKILEFWLGKNSLENFSFRTESINFMNLGATYFCCFNFVVVGIFLVVFIYVVVLSFNGCWLFLVGAFQAFDIWRKKNKKRSFAQITNVWKFTVVATMWLSLSCSCCHFGQLSFLQVPCDCELRRPRVHFKTNRRQSSFTLTAHRVLPTLSQ